MNSSRSGAAVPLPKPLAMNRWMTSFVNPGVVRIALSRSSRSAVTPVSSSSSRRAQASGASPESRVPAGISHRGPPAA